MRERYRRVMMPNGLALTGWIVLLALPTAAATAWFLRRRPLVDMRPHYVLGYAILAIAFVHLYLSMSKSIMRAANSEGLLLATIALLALLGQVGIGIMMQRKSGDRRALRRVHQVVFWTALALSAAHLVLNAPYFQRIVG